MRSSSGKDTLELIKAPRRAYCEYYEASAKQRVRAVRHAERAQNIGIA
jgi:hypothetical protein